MSEYQKPYPRDRDAEIAAAYGRIRQQMTEAVNPGPDVGHGESSYSVNLVPEQQQPEQQQP